MAAGAGSAWYYERLGVGPQDIAVPADHVQQVFGHLGSAPFRALDGIDALGPQRLQQILNSFGDPRHCELNFICEVPASAREVHRQDRVGTEDEVNGCALACPSPEHTGS
mgnify:FL=1